MLEIFLWESYVCWHDCITCQLHAHAASLLFYHITKTLYWIQIWWLRRPLKYTELIVIYRDAGFFWHAKLSCWKCMWQQSSHWQAIINIAQLVLRGTMCSKTHFPPHYTTMTSLSCWHKSGWVHGFMHLTLNSCVCISQHVSFLTPGAILQVTFFNFHLFRLCESVHTVVSDSCSCLTEAKPYVVFWWYILSE